MEKIMPRLKYPLAVPVKAGLKTINLFELRAETSLRDNVNDFREYADVLYSACLLYTSPRPRD